MYISCQWCIDICWHSCCRYHSEYLSHHFWHMKNNIIDTDIIAWVLWTIASVIKIWYNMVFRSEKYSTKWILFRILLWWGFATMVVWAIPDDKMTHKQIFAVWYFVWFVAEIMAKLIENNLQKKVEEKLEKF